MQAKFPYFHWIARLSVIVLAFRLSMWSGLRGFQTYDHSIIFDGGWRILCGQIPFKDFIAPLGPIAFYIQAGFFKLFGVNLLAFRLHAAVISAVVTALAMSIVGMLAPVAGWQILLTGLVTAVWFYTPMGIPWYGPTSMLFGYLLVWGCLKGSISDCRLQIADFKSNDGHAVASINPQSAIPNPQFLLCSLLAVLAFFTKQNSGLLILMMPLVLIPATYPKAKQVPALLAYIFGCGIFGALSVWLIQHYSNPDLFKLAFFDIPSGYTGSRFTIHALLSRVLLVHIVWGLGVFLLCLPALGQQSRSGFLKRCGLPLFFYFGGLGFHAAFILTSSTAAYFSIPFLGILITLSYFIVSSALLVYPNLNFAQLNRLRRGLTSIYVIGIVLTCTLGLWLTLSGRVKGDPVQSIGAPLKITGLEGLRWTETESNPTAEDFLNTLSYLRESKKPIYVFGASNVLYGLCGQPSLQPELWLHPGLTYPSHYDEPMASIDAWMTRNLAEHPDALLVMNIPPRNWTLDLPITWQQFDGFIKAHYVQVKEFGPYFRVFERKLQEDKS